MYLWKSPSLGRQVFFMISGLVNVESIAWYPLLVTGVAYSKDVGIIHFQICSYLCTFYKGMGRVVYNMLYLNITLVLVVLLGLLLKGTVITPMEKFE